MKYQGYDIEAVKEETLNHQMEPDDATSYSVSIGKKVVAVGLPTQQAAKDAIDRRCLMRRRAGLDPAG